MKLFKTVLTCLMLLAATAGHAADWKDILAEKNWSALLPEVKWRDYLPGSKSEPGVVAMVNGVPIEFRQVEGLYDMNRAIRDQGGFENDLPSLRAAYTEHLLHLVVQQLVRQELKSRQLEVGDDKVTALEAVIRQSYSEGEFERIMALDGIQPGLWREQLKARLELELFEAQVLKNVEVVPEAVEKWQVAHPNAGKIPETFTLMLILGDNRTMVEEARKAGIRDAASAAALQNAGLLVSQAHLSRAGLPPVWEKDILAMNPGQLSPVRALDGQFGYVALVEWKKAAELGPLALYAYIDEVLRRQAREEAYDLWLEQAVGKADIRVARSLLPDLVNKENTHSSMKPSAGKTVKPLANAEIDKSSGK